MKILITGAAGFIGQYAVREFLAHGYDVVGLDNFSKYGPVTLEHCDPAHFRFVAGDATDVGMLTELAADCDHVVAGAARIGGISYFHEFAYDLLAENERIVAATFDAALAAHRRGRLQKITVLSSSMVFENATQFPTPEGHEQVCPPPSSSYGFQKLACEYFARAAWTQYQLPYTIIRPFNCVGLGERRACASAEVYSGDIKLAMSHVVPDLIQKILKGQDPLRILGDGQQIRHYTYGGDIARGLRLGVERAEALNQDFNIATAESTTVRSLAERIWRRIHGQRPLHIVSDPPYPYDVQCRIPDVAKAKRLLGFEATTTLDTMLDELIPWIQTQVERGLI
ncbi:MAG: NAD-dependent epimerase/dehydratase family protein [Deltaproteobacteria bacterium]|nr:NAD-dependent epimerase/dehydratase family protein [Deltaproteobacteria bacterium]